MSTASGEMMRHMGTVLYCDDTRGYPAIPSWQGADPHGTKYSPNYLFWF